VYADGKARFELMEYRVQVVEKDKDDLRNDLKSIKDVLYRIDTRLSVFGAQLDERTGR
jgi:chaperonin cofactor prefoldin